MPRRPSQGLEIAYVALISADPLSLITRSSRLECTVSWSAHFSICRELKPPALRLACLPGYLAEKQLEIADPSDYTVRGYVRHHSSGHHTEHRPVNYACMPT